MNIMVLGVDTYIFNDMRPKMHLSNSIAGFCFVPVMGSGILPTSFKEISAVT